MSELTGKRGLIVGIANKRSIAWAIARAASAAGARLAVTYQGERLEENVRELATELADPLVLPCDVTVDAQIADVMASVAGEFNHARFRTRLVPEEDSLHVGTIDRVMPHSKMPNPTARVSARFTKMLRLPPHEVSLAVKQPNK